MKRLSRIMIFACSLFPVPRSLFADVPVSINYAGHLDGVSESGASRGLSEKNIMMAFRLYDAPGTGSSAEKATALWGRQASVSLENGDFDVDLTDNFGAVLAETRYGSLADALADAASHGISDLYLGLTPANDNNAEIWPRQKLTAVPKALQALYVNNVPDNFTATGGTFRAQQGLAVTGASTLGAGATYGSVTIPPTSQMSFRGGIDVTGTLRAGHVLATAVKAETVEAGTLETAGAAAVSVTGRLETAGTPVWDGDFAANATTLAAGTLRGGVSAKSVEAETLAAGNLVKKSDGTHLDTANKSWRIVGAIEEQSLPNQERVSNISFMSWNALSSNSDKSTVREAILTGVWTAPYDCIAYFQTEIRNSTPESAIVSACVQFYLVDDPSEQEFADRKPIGYASADKPGTVKTVVPVIVRKGENVKWLAYNANASKVVGVVEYEDAKVTAIRCQPFMW